MACRESCVETVWKGDRIVSFQEKRRTSTNDTDNVVTEAMSNIDAEYEAICELELMSV